MLQLTNLGWPDTPYGADKRPVAKKQMLLTGLAMQWAEGAAGVLPVSTAAVFLPLHRTRAVTIIPELLHFGFRMAVVEREDDGPEMLRFIDRILVQGRRHAAGLAWHAYMDDLHVIQTVASELLPGVGGVGEGWKDRTARERGTAPLVDTAVDVDHSGALLAEVAARHGLDLGPLHRFQVPAAAQVLYEDLTGDLEAAEQAGQDSGLPGRAGRELAVGALVQALAVALLGGKALDRLDWTPGFPLEVPIRLAAWDVLSSVLPPEPALSE